MSGMPNDIITIKPRILKILNDNREVIAFDKERNRKFLPEGEYLFVEVDNPNNSSIKALHLVSFENAQWYVSRHHLDTIGSWKEIESSN